MNHFQSHFLLTLTPKRNKHSKTKYYTRKILCELDGRNERGEGSAKAKEEDTRKRASERERERWRDRETRREGEKEREREKEGFSL